MTWDDFTLGGDVSHGPEPVEPYLPVASLPSFVRDMLDDPSRPKATRAVEVYPIHEFIFERWVEHEGIRAMDHETGTAYNDRNLRAIGIVPGTVAADGRDFRSAGAYIKAVSNSVFNALTWDYHVPSSAEPDTDLDLAVVIPDEGALIGDIATAMGVSRRTAEKRVAALMDEGRVVAVDEPTGRGGMPRKRYFRSGTAPEGDA